MFQNKIDAAFDEGEEDGWLDITSMVDIVFILLAFFVLTTRFVQSEQDLGISQHGQGSGQLTAEDMPEKVRVRLTVAGEDVVIHLGERELPLNDFAQLTAQLTVLNLPDTPVILAPAAELTNQQVADAIQAVLKSPMQAITFESLQQKGGAP